MKTLQFKKVEKDLHSKKQWEDLKVPECLIKNLTSTPLVYARPSIIQTAAIPKIHEMPGSNFVFQSMNGSGKTGAFCVPAIMRVDPTIKALQVLIIGGATRELNRQTKKILEILTKDLGVTVCFGEKSEKFETSHIMVTTLGYVT